MLPSVFYNTITVTFGLEKRDCGQTKSVWILACLPSLRGGLWAGLKGP